MSEEDVAYVVRRYYYTGELRWNREHEDIECKSLEEAKEWYLSIYIEGNCENYGREKFSEVVILKVCEIDPGYDKEYLDESVEKFKQEAKDRERQYAEERERRQYEELKVKYGVVKS